MPLGRTIVVAALLALASAAEASASSLPAPPTERALYADGHAGRHLLDSGWMRRLDPEDRGLDERWHERASAEGWGPVAVPDAWNATELTPAGQEGGVAWYRTHFALPEGPAPGGWRIRFESVNLRAKVFVNGREAGSHTGAHLPFEVPGTLLRPGGNTLTVRVDNRRLPTDLPPFERSGAGLPGGGWWNDGGILREVYLRRVERLEVDSIEARTNHRGRVTIRTRLVNATAEPLTAKPSIRVGGRRVALGALSLKPGAGRTVVRTTKIAKPRRWTPRRPHLYPLELRDGERVLYRMRVGLRTWSVRRGILHLNGRRTRLFGASMHEDEAGRGMATTAAGRKSDVDWLVRLGATVTRAHYPLHPALLELLDEKGIAVWSQIPAYRYSNEALENAGVRRRALDYLAEAIRRDRNHPSVLAFSSGNELSSRPRPGARRYIRAAARRTRALAPGALAALDISSYPTVGRKAVYAESLDALGLNEYFGWYLGPRRITASRRSLGPYLDRARRSYPRLALFVTEFGAETNRSGPRSEKGTYGFQSDFLRYHVRTIARRPFVNGALVWLLRDFRTRPGFTGGNPKPNPPFNQKGLLRYDSTPKPAFRSFRTEIRKARRARADR